jgi:hypothetical protein
MNIDVVQYRGSIGQHYTVSRTPMTRKRLRYLDVLCISLFNIHGLRVLPIAIFLFFVPLYLIVEQYFVRLNEEMRHYF